MTNTSELSLPLLNVAHDDVGSEEIPVMKDWLGKVKNYRDMYGSAVFFYTIMTALIDIPLIIIPIVCATFNMSKDLFGTVGYYVLNGLIALIPILHGIQKYFMFNETLSALKRARSTFDGMAFEIQMYIVQMRHYKDDQVIGFMEDLEKRIVESTEVEMVPFWIKGKFSRVPNTSPSPR